VPLAPPLDWLHTVLSDDERGRASRFVFARDRDRFVYARGALRIILGKYLRRMPCSIEFGYEAAGKPRLRDTSATPPIRFNISYSEDLAAVAFSWDRELGIDIEALGTLHDSGIADRFFSDKEREELRSLPADAQREGFYLAWTRKEAYVKAIGTGLNTPLDSFDVSLTPEGPESLATKDGRTWTLRSFRPAEDYVAAVVVAGTSCELNFFAFSAPTAGV
jgi:4'-phosphopantetheinyl transferase